LMPQADSSAQQSAIRGSLVRIAVLREKPES